jgi:catalase
LIVPVLPPKPRPIIGPALLIAAIVVALAAAFAWAAGVIGPRRLSGGTIADALEKSTGTAQPGYRRAHAKGLCLSGSFDATGAGTALATAQIFQRGRYPVIGRFSLGGGNPLASDGRNVFHAMALRLRTGSGEEWRMALDHTPIFPVATPAAFVELQRASRPDPHTGKPDPAAMQAYLARHPETRAFQDFIKQAVLPNSFANATYYSINAFRFTAPDGETHNVRWQMVPETPLAGLDKDRLGTLPRDYLFDEMIARSARGPSRWHLQLVVANPGDPTDNATIAWHGPHRTVDAGLLTVDRVEPEEQGACRDLNFDPTILPPGIALSDDPLLAARAKTYSTSFTRRAGEAPGPSAAGKALHQAEIAR